MADYWEPSGDEDEPVTSGLGKREKRLARNRESARKCRKKRKAFVNEMAEKVQALTEDNAILELENRRLQELVRQLQSGASTAPAPSSRKRVKREQGALVANDFSESAVHASPSQQPETFYYPLATWTTLLLLLMLKSAMPELVCSPVKQSAMTLPETPAYVPVMLKTPCHRQALAPPPQHEAWCAQSSRSLALTAVT
jgi:hypothetical protein